MINLVSGEAQGCGGLREEPSRWITQHFPLKQIPPPRPVSKDRHRRAGPRVWAGAAGEWVPPFRFSAPATRV